MKTLVICFKNAGVFSHPQYSTDRSYIGNEGYKRDGVKHIRPSLKNDGSKYPPLATLDTRHVSNMLHVLAGERPVPSLVPTIIKKNEDIYKIAKESYVKINLEAEEKKTVRKAIPTSFNPSKSPMFLNGKTVQVRGGLLYHERIRQSLGDIIYESFLAVVKEVGGDPKNLTGVGCIELLNKNNREFSVKKFYEQCRDNHMTSFYNLIAPNGNTASTHFESSASCKLNMLLVNSGVESIRKYSGEILCPVPENLLHLFRRGSGFARILEGGFCKITRVDDWYECNILGYEKTREGEFYVPGENP
jgi:hypothetical protein